MLVVADSGEVEEKAGSVKSVLNEGNGITQDSDWRTSISTYLQNPSQKTDRAVRRLALKYTLVDNTLYRRTIDGLLLKCLNEDEARVAMGEVHDGLCGTHQSAHKMKWMLRRDDDQ
jgi:hypothetical protein